MHSVTGWVLYFLFAIILAAMYLAIRRGWAPPGAVAGIGTVASIICMVMLSLAQGNVLLQAVVVGILVGAVFSGATLATAWYFHSNELKARGPGAQAPAARPAPPPADEDY